MTRFFLSMMFFSLSICPFGQIENELNSILRKRDFPALQKFIGAYQLEKDSIQIRFGNVRDLTDGFQEAMIYVSKSYSYNKGASISCNPRLNIIKEGYSIVYYHLETKQMKNFPKDFKITSDTTYQFVDNKKMDKLKYGFEKTFHASFNEAELFLDRISYGLQQTKETPVTKEQQQVNLWVNQKDTTGLLTWLQSTNTEKQVYAVQGFFSLKKAGWKPDAITVSVIKNVLKKKGTINAFLPCDGGERDISAVVKEFKF